MSDLKEILERHDETMDALMTKAVDNSYELGKQWAFSEVYLWILDKDFGAKDLDAIANEFSTLSTKYKLAWEIMKFKLTEKNKKGE